jgi:hypothetical protein
MAALTTSSLSLPDEILDPWLGKVQYGSCIAALSNSIPMKFGQGHSMTFDIGEAEYVTEGANKGSSTITPTTVTTKPYKFHKTVRWTEEVKWADEDEKVNVVSQVLDLIQPALSRALDIGVIHAINPAAGGTAIAGATALDTATAQVERVATDKAYANLDAADALVLANGYIPSGVALSPLLASKFSALRGVNSEQKLYPNFGLTTAVTELDGHRASVSRTVNAGGVPSAPTLATQTLGIDGDFNAIRWGIQRAIGIEMIEYGDPDGGGDLKRNNQVAFRAEVVYGWGIADLNAFALIVDKVAG